MALCLKVIRIIGILMMCMPQSHGCNPHQSNPLADIAKVPFRNSTGKVFQVPPEILMQSPFFTESLQKCGEVIIPVTVSAEHLAFILCGLYLKQPNAKQFDIKKPKVATMAACLDWAYEDEMIRLIQKFEHKAVPGLVFSRPYDDTPAAQYLIYLLEHTDELQHDQLTDLLAYTLTRHRWRKFSYDLEEVYRQLWHANARRSASAIAKFALLLNRTRLIESDKPLDTRPIGYFAAAARSLLRMWSIPNSALTIPRTSCPIALDDYLTYWDNFGVGRKNCTHLLNLAQLMLGNIRPLAKLDVGNVRILDLTRNHLTSLDGITALQALCALYLKNNALIALPSLTHLTNLRVLDLQYNKFTRLQSNSFEQLTSLQEVNVCFNPLTFITPNGFSALPTLQLIVNSDLLSKENCDALHQILDHRLQRLVL